MTEPALFLTRWITHFCAPGFIFLAGVSAFLYGTRHTTGEVSRYLFTRGCWLVLIEFTLVRVGWTFSLSFDHLVIQVIFTIGAAMIALAIFVHLPRAAIATIGLAMVVGHNMFDGVKTEQFGDAAPIWNLLHKPGASRSWLWSQRVCAVSADSMDWRDGCRLCAGAAFHA